MLTDHLPRIRLAHLPTPLEEPPRLSSTIGGPRLPIKRDDQIGLATGGNKARTLEFRVADALLQRVGHASHPGRGPIQPLPADRGGRGALRLELHRGATRARARGLKRQPAPLPDKKE